MIPKIIHQTWKTTEIPQAWQESIPSWQRHHPGWRHILWTDADLERFIAGQYPWFMDTYRDYPMAIQRVDAARYFILHEYGGLYSDLDIICTGSFDFLLSCKVVLPKTEPIGFSNDLMMAEPGHPFFRQVIDCLAEAHGRYSRHPLLLSHFRVMFSTGPLYLTRQVRACPAKEGPFILPPSLYSGRETAAIVRHVMGNSWHGWDSRLLGFLFARIRTLLFLGTALAAGCLLRHFLR
jgi:inositol phosphorylceramide mannosyltransferase catalytic subunit